MEAVFRDRLRASDPEVIKRVTEQSGVFSPCEVAMAQGLAQESLHSGAEASGYYFILAEAKDQVIGYVCFGPTPCTKYTYDLYWIAVQDAWRHTGIGDALLAQAEERIASLGGKKVYVETSSRDPYAPARRFYQKHRYSQEAVLHDFYDDGDDKVIYSKVLQSTETQDPDQNCR